MLELAMAEHIAHLLLRESPEPVAFLECDGTIYFARAQAAAPHLPFTAIVSLIQAVYEHSPEQSRRIVRNRIFSTSPPTEMCWGMTKVAAQRLTAPVTAKDHGLSCPFRFEELGVPLTKALSRSRGGTGPQYPLSLWNEARPPSTDAEFMRLARKLAAQVSRDRVLHECDRPIGALLVDATNQILAWGINSNAANKTLHAEVNLMQAFARDTGQGLPAGSRLYATLKPCRMCAGMIWTCAADLSSLRVIYGEFDPGPGARETILDANSPDRRRLPRLPGELKLEIQQQLPAELP